MDCLAKTFPLDYRYKTCVPGVKRQVVEMAINGSGIRDTGASVGGD
ncbi:IS1-like element transposase [Methylobacter sp. G7]